MSKYIMAGLDVHDKQILAKASQDRSEPEVWTVANTREGRERLFARLQTWAEMAGAERIVIAYEASCLGFGLCDDAKEAGITCHVLAPTKIRRSPQERRRKTDERDAQRLLELLRAHVLAGNDLPAVWVPDRQTRDDREVVRARLDAADKQASVKTQVRTLLKRQALARPKGLPKGWGVGYEAWLRRLLREDGGLEWGARTALATLLRQKEALKKEVKELDRAVKALSKTLRYAAPVRELMRETGVALLTAMVFLTEMGDMRRFRNRKQVGAYVGLVPTSAESGETNDHKGHITHEGSWRVRRVLCQATWARVRGASKERAAYDRIVAKNPKHKKIAVVAEMRRLVVRLWRLALASQPAEAYGPGAAAPAI